VVGSKCSDSGKVKCTPMLWSIRVTVYGYIQR
jgi:hypothetical protein